MKQIWPAAERNKQPILEVLRRVLPSEGTVLEIASGTGQHAAFFASQLPALTFQPSDIDDENLASIRAWVDEARLANLRPPLKLDVTQPEWGVGTVDAIFNANMIHIAPWDCCMSLVAGAGRHLRPAGVLVMYGPFSVGGAHTAPSNADFDASLKSRDLRWGVRDSEAVTALAEEAGLSLQERVPMPANNQALIFTR
jgi:SAM-dependent methyltransferase